MTCRWPLVLFIVIFAGVNGYLDKVETKDVGRFEEELLRAFRGSHADILSTIRSEKALSDDTSAKVKDAVEAFAKAFA